VCERFFKLGLLFFFIAINSACPQPAVCKQNTGLRTSDVIKTVGSNVTVVSLDTAPSPGSSLFQSALDSLGYDYYLLGTTEEKPQPARNGIFRQALWYYRFNRYHDIVTEIAARKPKQIIALSDANDVLFVGRSSAVEAAFKELGKDIVITGQIYCCNVRQIDYVREVAKDLHIDNIESADPRVQEIVKPLAISIAVMGKRFGGQDLPGWLWTEPAQRIMRGIKKIQMKPNGPATKYRYVNAGGIIGYADAIMKAMSEIDMQPYDDDEQKWNTWYAEIGYPSGRATIDYEQKIFAMVNDPGDIQGDTRILFDDVVELPERKFFDLKLDDATSEFVNAFGNRPKVFHCAGCWKGEMKDFRTRIVNSFANFSNIFKAQDLDFLQSCE